jgi:hypothetical protein
MMDIKLKGSQPYDPTGLPSKLTRVRKAPHKGLIFSLEVKLDMFQICSKFVESKKHRKTFQLIGRIFPFLLSKRPGSERYWLAFALKLLEEDGGNNARTCISL